MKLLRIFTTAAMLMAPAGAAKALTLEDMIQALENAGLNQAGSSGQVFQAGTEIKVLAFTALLYGPLEQGGTPVPVYLEQVGGIHFYTQITGALPVENWTLDAGAQTITEKPGNIPGNSATGNETYHYNQEPDRRGMALLVSQQNPASPCLGGALEPVLSAYTEYGYGVVWCRNTQPPSGQASVKKNYHYMFGSGEQMLVLTLNFSCATEQGAMPPGVASSACS